MLVPNGDIAGGAWRHAPGFVRAGLALSFLPVPTLTA